VVMRALTTLVSSLRSAVLCAEVLDVFYLDFLETRKLDQAKGKRFLKPLKVLPCTQPRKKSVSAKSAYMAGKG